MYVVSKLQETHQVFKHPSNKCEKVIVQTERILTQWNFYRIRITIQ